MLQPLVELELVGVDEQLADDGLGEIPVGLLGQHQIAEFTFNSQERELVFRAATTLELAGVASAAAAPDR